jgi:uncharacterized membrane protein
MKHRDFTHKLDERRVVQAIGEAERKTSGEIRVFVSRRPLGSDSVIERAARQFEKLGMTRTRERNGILLYFVPREQRFAVIGDEGIHARCGQDFWEHMAEEIGRELASGHFTQAVVGAVREAGEALARHFPASPEDRDELSNEVGED